MQIATFAGEHPVASRERLVNAVKAEVENVRSARATRRIRACPLPRGSPRKTRVTSCLSLIGQTDAASRRSTPAQDGRQFSKANAIVHLLDDVRVNLESLGEQKVVGIT